MGETNYLNMEHWRLHIINELEQIGVPLNWYTFTPLKLEFEYEKITDSYELVMMFLGIGFRLSYDTDKALAKYKEWEKMV